MRLHYLTYDDRQKLERLYREGVSLSDIAGKLGVHLSTVYRDLARGETGELDRNGRSAYSADRAQEVARQSMKRKGRKPTLNKTE